MARSLEFAFALERTLDFDCLVELETLDLNFPGPRAPRRVVVACAWCGGSRRGKFPFQKSGEGAQIAK